MVFNIIVAPVLLPLITAVILLIWRHPSYIRRWVAAISSFIHIIISLFIFKLVNLHNVLVLPMGGWKAPFGITLTIDHLSIVMILLCSIVTFTCVLYGFAESKVESDHPLRLPLIQFMVAGICLSFSTGDLFNMFVAFELMLIASYALLTLEAKDRDIKHTLPYLGINLLGGTLFFCAGGLAYSLFGSLNFADISLSAEQFVNDPRLVVMSILFLVVFGLKAGFFPLYYWLPNSYPTLPTPLAALYSSMLTKVGIYGILRIFGTILPHSLLGPYGLILLLAGPTMMFGIFAALSRKTIRGILCFNLISHIGFMMVAIGIFSQKSLAACIFYIIHHVLVIASLFLLGGIIRHLNGSDHLDKMGNLWDKAPFLGVLFLVQILSLAGLPPFSGFWGKFLIIREALSAGSYLLVALLIIASILTLWSLLNIWFAAFWTRKPELSVNLDNIVWKRMTMVTSFIIIISLSVGFGANSYVKLANRSSAGILDQPAYREAVFKFKGLRVAKHEENTPASIHHPIGHRKH